MRKLARWFAAGRRAEAGAAPALPVDLSAPEVVADPAPVWAWLRENAPVAEMRSGGVILTRHADIREAFTDARLGNAPSRFSALGPRNAEKYTAAALAAHIPPFQDKPAHVRSRRALSAAFFRAFEEAEVWVPGVARAHLVAGQGDLVARIASPFACAVMARFVGLDAGRAEVKRATAAFFRLFAPITDAAAFAETNAALDAVRGELTRALAARRTAPGADVLSELLAQEAPLSDAEIVDNALLVLADGVENIEAGIASVLRVLSARPEVTAAIREGAVPLEAAVREALRLETPGQVIPRVAREAHERQGVEIGAGVPVFLALGSANRDPGAHPDPDRFDAGRFGPARGETPVTFGLGRHRCIGEPLALLQITAMIGALLEAGVRDLGAPLAYRDRFGHRWPAALEVMLPG